MKVALLGIEKVAGVVEELDQIALSLAVGLGIPVGYFVWADCLRVELLVKLVLLG
jgi:hypothetical protein